jgi:hypothetical protein
MAGGDHASNKGFPIAFRTARDVSSEGKRAFILKKASIPNRNGVSTDAISRIGGWPRT